MTVSRGGREKGREMEGRKEGRRDARRIRNVNTNRIVWGKGRACLRDEGRGGRGWGVGDGVPGGAAEGGGLGRAGGAERRATGH